jgi:predicted dehydrogenase
MSDQLARRAFLKTTGSALAAAPAVLSAQNTNSKLGVAVVGVGTRGFYLMQEFQRVPGVDVRVICDLYDGHLKRAKEFAVNTHATYTKQWEKAISDPNVDAVVIATPEFWHYPMVMAAAKAKKDIYVEKAWCTSIKQAKEMRKAIKDNGVVMQLGHNRDSDPTYHKAMEYIRQGKVNPITVVRMIIDRTDVLPQWKFYGDYYNHTLPSDASPQTIDWERFTAAASKRPFDAERFFRWRNWWEYSSGIAGDLMTHLWDSANFMLNMGIPETCMTQGGLYFWKKDQEVPDTWNAIFDYPKQNMVMTFGSNFQSVHDGDVVRLLGREGTIEVSRASMNYYEAEWKTQKPGAPAQTPKPAYTFKKGDLEVTTHWQDFVDAVHKRSLPRCNVDHAFQEVATLCMSLESYHQDRKVRWDPIKEEIV